MYFHMAVRAAQDNLTHHVTADRDPASYNISVALLNIAQGLEALESKVEHLQRDIDRMKHLVEGVAGKVL